MEVLRRFVIQPNTAAARRTGPLKGKGRFTSIASWKELSWLTPPKHYFLIHPPRPHVVFVHG